MCLHSRCEYIAHTHAFVMQPEIAVANENNNIYEV